MTPDRPRRPRARTVRFRVTALAAVATALVLGLTAVVLVTVQRRALTGSLDETLAAEAAALAREVGEGGEVAGGGVAGGGASLPAPRLDDDAVAQVVVGGEVVAASRGAPTGRPLVDVDGDGAQAATVDEVPGGDGGFRVATRPVAGGAARTAAVVVVAAPLDDIDESTGLLATSLAVAVPAVTALLAAVVWWLVGRTLRPVEAIRREVAGITGGVRGRRVPEPPGDDEVARLARTMNAMLGRLDDAAERQRRFVGDASHELRSPLARIRSDIEVDLAHPEVADPDATHGRVLDEALAMQRLVDDLLRLARADDGASDDDRPGPSGAAAADAVAVDALVADEVERARARAPRIAVDLDVPTPVTVRGDDADLRRAVANVVDNALRHARSRVEVSVTVDGAAVVAVADDGPGVPPERAEWIFGRFTRLDDARARPGGGAGLGLAIARAVAERHGGTLRVDPHHAGGARFVLRLPAPRATT